MGLLVSCSSPFRHRAERWCTRTESYADVREICTYAREDIIMFKEFRKELEWGGKPLIVETGKVARQADGCVIVTYGGSTVLCAVVGEKKPKPGLDFFPLTVHYVEKAYAAGKIPGGFFKREGRPTEKEMRAPQQSRRASAAPPRPRCMRVLRGRRDGHLRFDLGARHLSPGVRW